MTMTRPLFAFFLSIASASSSIAAQTKSSNGAEKPVPVAISASTLQMTKQIQKRAVNEIIDALRTHYGMLIYKNQLFNVDLEKLEAKYYDLIDRAQLPHEKTAGLRQVFSQDELVQLLIAMSADLKDGHTNIRRKAVGGWSTGIIARKVGDRLIVVKLDPKVYAEDRSVTPIQVGDEIVSIDGVSVQDLAKQYMVYAQLATFETRYKFALETLLVVPASGLPGKTIGSTVEVNFRHAGEAKEYAASLAWTRLSPNDPSQRVSNGHIRQLEALADVKLDTQDDMTPEGYTYGDRGTHSYFKVGLELIKNNLGEIENVGQLINEQIKKKSTVIDAFKNKQSEAIKLAPVTRLEAYTVLHKGKRLGVLRIPDYSPDKPEDFLREVAWIRLVLAHFNRTTDGLIIDQLSNGGGYVSYVTILMGLFANEQKLKTYSLDHKISQTLLNDVDFFNAGDELFNKNLTNLQLNQANYNYIKDLFEKGITMSGPIPMMGTAAQGPKEQYGAVYPDDGVAFQKKVLILNDLASGSGGDFFPFAMQGNGRAKVFGSTSMGLGGPVYRSDDSKTSAEVTFRNTYGLARLFNGTHIENVGSVPDFTRNVSQKDIVDNFKTFASDALDVAVSYFDGQDSSKIQAELAAKLKRESTADYTALVNVQSTLKQTSMADGDLAKILEEYNSQLKNYVTKLKSSSSTLPIDSIEALQLDLPKALSARDEVLASLNESWAVSERLEQIVNRYDDQKNLTANEQIYLKKVWGSILGNKKIRQEILNLAKTLKSNSYFFIRPILRDKAAENGGVLRPQGVLTCSDVFKD